MDPGSISSPVTSEATSASSAAPSSISPVEPRPTEKTSLIFPFWPNVGAHSIHRSRGIGIVVVVSVAGAVQLNVQVAPFDWPIKVPPAECSMYCRALPGPMGLSLLSV